MKCSCGQSLQSGFAFCPKCGTKVVNLYANPVGTWHVTTEGDCEGKTIKDLGVHTGHVADIARALGSRSYYALQFEPVLTSDTFVPEECQSVNVRMGVDSGTWNMTVEDRLRWMRNFLSATSAKCSLSVIPGQYFSSVTLKF